MEIENKLKAMGLELPAAGTPPPGRAGAVRVGNLLFVGGHTASGLPVASRPTRPHTAPHPRRPSTTGIWCGPTSPLTGTGKINPLAAIGAAGMLLTHTGQTAAGAAVEAAVATVAGALPSLAAGEMGMSTSEVADRVRELVTR